MATCHQPKYNLAIFFFKLRDVFCNLKCPAQYINFNVKMAFFDQVFSTLRKQVNQKKTLPALSAAHEPLVFMFIQKCCSNFHKSETYQFVFSKGVACTKHSNVLFYLERLIDQKIQACTRADKRPATFLWRLWLVKYLKACNLHTSSGQRPAKAFLPLLGINSVEMTHQASCAALHNTTNKSNTLKNQAQLIPAEMNCINKGLTRW